MVDKVVKDGKVAILFSPDYGAGWSSWNEGLDPADGRYVQLFLDGNFDEFIELAEEEDLYCGGVDDLRVAWIPQGTRYRIDEYDGAESIQTEDDVADWHVA